MAANTMGNGASGSGMSGRDRVLGALQSFARSLMLPIAVLPAAALILRLGQPDLLDLPWMASAGQAVFTNLPILFALGIAVGLTGGAGAAAIAALVGFLVFAGTFNAIATSLAPEEAAPISSLGAVTSMGVLSGILVGLVAAESYRRYSDIRLPDYLGFFGGRRFVPIVTALAALLLGAIFGLIWPTIQVGVDALGAAIVGLGAVGTGLYGLFNRLLIPVGLHQVLNTFIWFQLGSFEGPDGAVTGDLNRYFAGDPSAGLFMSGFFPIFMFGLPAACLAMWRHARFPKVAAGILFSAAFASFLTGITEPIEFAFLFAAPLLYLVHAVLTGTALAICTLLGIRMGFGFSAGAIDYVLNFTNPNTSGAVPLLLIGLAYGALYYFVFSFFIKRFNLATPGRGDTNTGLSADWILPESQRVPRAGEERETAREAERQAEGQGERQTERAGVSAGAFTAERDRDDVLAENVLEALGGRENVQSVEGCITRLRLFVDDPERVQDARLKELGAAGVVKRGRVAQVVMGTQSDRIAERMNRLLKDGR